MSESPTRFEAGDRIVHEGRPEWGIGHVSRAAPELHEGRPCQRLTVRFERAGVKTLSTALAHLHHAQAEPAHNGDDAPSLVGANPEEVMTRLPDRARDPFSTPLTRLGATLDLYRFGRDGGALLDWAASQSGLADPLTRFSRHDLEVLYDRFRRRLDEHLSQLITEVKRSVGVAVSQDELQRVVTGAPEAGRAALKRLSRTR
ncbi:MAG: DUF3553 domain-containing protein [Phycisphaerales bacterium]